MQTKMMSQSTCGSAFNRVDLRDRFQGALIGLRLAPVAIFLESRSAKSLLYQATKRVADDGIAQTKAFAIAPNNWELDTACLSDSACWLPACVPMLLRYHNDWQQRLAILSKLQAYQPLDCQSDRAPRDFEVGIANQNKPADKAADKAAATESVHQSIAQILLLGDVLETMSVGAMPAAPTDWLRWLDDRSSRYSAILPAGAHYKTALAAIAKNMQIDYPIGSLASRNAGEPHRAFAAGISSALLHPESYLFAVRGLTGNDLTNSLANTPASSPAKSPAEDLQSTGGLASVCLSVCVAGFLSGALSGRHSLPVLLQLPLSVERDLASELFIQWTGQRSTGSNN